MKLVLAVFVAAPLFVGVVAVQPAEARCFWDGFSYECYHPYGGYWHRPWWRHHHHYYHYWRGW
jgi:hypothetical protein